ncbi:MAG: Rrf2 family transcriptional regulator [Nitrospirae bacterium]|nr:MAG: Rrf2 family transcriptional regulator [Nitrospirota bacterium]
MKFSKKSEYALRALLELTRQYDQRPVRRAELAQAQRIPLGFLENIMLPLKHQGIVASRRGVDGGFRLRRPPSTITLGSVIRALDGPLAPIGCVSQTAYQMCDDCPYATQSTCPIQQVMLKVRNAIASVLDRYTLEDFANSAPFPTRRARSSAQPRRARTRS